MTDSIINVGWQDWDAMAEEQLVLTINPDDIIVESRLTSPGGSKLIADYHLVCDEHWRVRFFNLIRHPSGDRLTLHADGDGHWTDGSQRLYDLDGAIDIDLSASPFTNTLPIRRLNLAIGQSTEILVTYVAFPELDVSVDRQRYTCRAPLRRYFFEQLTTGFTCEIETDENGLVTRYPGLFKRIS